LLASHHGFKKYYITHQLSQVDIGITNAGIYFSLANPHLKNKEGQRRKFNEDIALHFITVKLIDWQVLYGNSVLDVCDSDTTRIPGGHDSDDEDLMEQLGVPSRPENLSPIKDLAVMCHPCIPFDKEFMDTHDFKCLTKK
jgi:hypothetical protein